MLTEGDLPAEFVQEFPDSGEKLDLVNSSAELYLGRSLSVTTFSNEAHFSKNSEWLILNFFPLVAVDSLKVYGQEVPVEAFSGTCERGKAYRTEQWDEEGRLFIPGGIRKVRYLRDLVTRDVLSKSSLAVSVSYQAGLSDIPALLKQSLLSDLRSYLESNETFEQGNIIAERTPGGHSLRFDSSTLSKKSPFGILSSTSITLLSKYRRKRIHVC